MAFGALMAATSVMSGGLGYLQSRANRRAMARANSQLMKLLKQSREDLTPWMQKGLEASDILMEKLREGPGEYQNSPGYKLAVAEGQKRIEQSAAARGGLTSGATGKALAVFGQAAAQSDYDKFLNRYYNSLKPYAEISKTGLQAAGMIANASGGFGQQGAGYLSHSGGGDAYAGMANAITSGAENYVFAKTLGGLNNGGGTNSGSVANSVFNSNRGDNTWWGINSWLGK